MNGAMQIAIWIYLSIGALIGAGMAVLFVAETSRWPLPTRFLGVMGVWLLVTIIWPVTLTVLVLGKLQR